LRGDWDLRDTAIVINPGADDFRQLNGRFYLVRRTSPRFIDVRFGENWFDPERDAGTNWSWSGGTGVLVITNPGTEPVHTWLRFDLNSFATRDVHVRRSVGGEILWSGQVGQVRVAAAIDALELPPGETLLEIYSPQPPAGPESDTRPLVVALYDLRANGAPPPVE
jgi:hypothetical protein